MKTGKLFVVDGTDGSGKATQTKRLVERLISSGRAVATLDFPRYKTNFYGRFIRECLDGKHGDFIGTDPYLASIPYANDRRESKPEIEAFLEKGDLVLDRYVSANQIHQGGKIRDLQKRKEYLSWMQEMEYGIHKLPKPDLVFYLHVNVEVSMKLARDRATAKGESPDKAEENARHQHESQESALSIIRSDDSWVLIDCNDGNGGILSQEVIHEKIWQEALKIISL